MLGWIIYRKNEAELTMEAYEIRRFLEIAGQESIDVKVLKPEQFDLIGDQGRPQEHST